MAYEIRYHRDSRGKPRRRASAAAFLVGLVLGCLLLGGKWRLSGKQSGLTLPSSAAGEAGLSLGRGGGPASLVHGFADVPAD